METGLTNSRHGSTDQFTSYRYMGVMAVLMMTSLVPGSLGCFPVEDVFKESCLWIQTTSLQSRNRIYVCPENRGIEPGAPMKIEFEGFTSHHEEPKTLTCLRDYGRHRYKVKVTNPAGTVVKGYQCLKFSPLSDIVIRQEKSDVVVSENQLDCSKAVYALDEAVLIAGYLDLVPRPCPLAGGFQLLMSMGRSDPSENCLDSSASYLPQLLFECDKSRSSHALIDLGRKCTSQSLWDSQTLRGRYMAHLRCLASWQENSGGRSREFTTVLLGFRDSYRSYWCLHLQRLAGKGSGSSEEIMYKAILTLDGRCVPDMSEQGFSPKATDMVGRLVSFSPVKSTECTDNAYMRSCDTDGGAITCRESLRCPSRCGRCKEELKAPGCTFPDAMKGSWESFSYDDKPSVSIGKDAVQSAQFGQFKCRSPAELGDALGMYPLVQTGVEPTCWPYYSCAQLRSLAPGLLSFQMRPALRDIYTGQIKSCQETYREVWSIRPEKAEETKTLLDRNRLKPVPCEFDEPQIFPTLGLVPGCGLVVPRCSGPCHSFNISLEVGSCDNTTAASAALYIEHVCMARITFDNGNQAVLTKILDTAEDSEEYRCWLFAKSRLYLLFPDDCNEAQIASAFEYDGQPEFTYDPFFQLIKSVSHSSNRGGSLVAVPNLAGLGFLLSSLLLVSLVRSY